MHRRTGVTSFLRGALLTTKSIWPYIDRMVNKELPAPVTPALPRVTALVGIYLGVVLLTIVALAVMSVIAPDQATEHAWGHAIVVAVFAVLLPLRLRSAQRGRRGAIRAVGIIAAVLLVANVVEALLPGFVPEWMRGQMILVALLMLGVVIEVVRYGIGHPDR